MQMMDWKYTWKKLNVTDSPWGTSLPRSSFILFLCCPFGVLLVMSEMPVKNPHADRLKSADCKTHRANLTDSLHLKKLEYTQKLIHSWKCIQN